MSWQQFKHAWLIKFWAPIPAVIAAGILSTYYFGITGTFWAVTGEFTRWGGQLLQLFGVHAEEWGYFKIIHLEGSPLTDAPRDKCTLSCAINGIHAAFHYLKKNYISGCVMTVPTGW